MTTEQVVRNLYRGVNGGLASVAEFRFCHLEKFQSLPEDVQQVANRYIKNRQGDSAGRAVLLDWLKNNTIKKPPNQPSTSDVVQT